MRPRMLSEGEHFGEICLFVSNLKRTASVVATTNAYVYTLASDDFNNTLRWYPSEKIEMQRVAIERMEILLNNVKRVTKMRKSRATVS
jgi:CRP-like cAMP-binding protein